MPTADWLTSARGRSAAAIRPSTRFLVARSWLSRMRCFASSVRRWLIRSPIRLTTASTPSSEASGGRQRRGSHSCPETVGWVFAACVGLRERPATSSPRARSASQTREPIIPLAPVTSTRMRNLHALSRTGSIDGLEGPGLLRDPGDARLPRLFDDGLGDRGGHLAVEDAGDDVFLGQVLLGDDLRDAVGGRELHLLGDCGGAGVEGPSEDAGEREDVVCLGWVVGRPGGHYPDIWGRLLRHGPGVRVR